MDAWRDALREHLQRLEKENLLRRLHAVQRSGPCLIRGGCNLIDLSSNDYLGLSQHPHLLQAAHDALNQYGAGAGASRLVSGHLTLHERVEQRFAAFKHAQAALIFPSGYMANLATLTALARPGDLVCLDKLNHASLIDGIRASGATARVYPHLDYAKLQRLLEMPLEKATDSHAGRCAGPPRRLIATDSVFSMDGDVADLPRLCDLADRYDAILLVDEAHGTGVLGPSGAGLAQAQGVSERIDVTISTASKALGSLGGIVTAGREVIDTIVNLARPFIFSTGAPPAQAALIDAAMDVLRDEPWRRQRLHELSKHLRQSLQGLSWLQHRPQSAQGDDATLTPIVPLIVGSAQAALALSNHLESQGFFAPAIRPPTVAPQTCRVRLSLRADLKDQHIDRLLACLRCVPPALLQPL